VSDAVWSYIGAATGIVAVIVSLVSAVRVSRMKALDLRLELYRVDNATRQIADDLPGLFDRAQQSHTAISIATGSFKSGNFVHWTNLFEADKSQASALIQEFNESRCDDVRDHSHAELEALLRTTDRSKLKLAAIRDKYVASLAADVKASETLHQDQMAVALTKMSKPFG
jgi:hypothetical protein